MKKYMFLIIVLVVVNVLDGLIRNMLGVSITITGEISHRVIYGFLSLLLDTLFIITSLIAFEIMEFTRRVRGE